MNDLWSDALKRLVPYVPGEQPQKPDIIKLNTNEHALGPSVKALKAGAELDPEKLRRYPDPTSRALTEAIAASCGVTADNVMVTNGSDEVLAFAWIAFLSDANQIPAVPSMTYSFYPVWAQLLGHGIQTIPMQSDLSLNLDALKAWNGPIVFPNPNAPTGIAVSRAEIADLCRANPSRLVIIDEAYFGFGAETAVPLTEEFSNLLITRSFSKSHALAGLRVGYGIGSSELIEGIRRVKDSFNSYPVDAHAQAVAKAAIGDLEWFESASQTVMSNREALRLGLEQLGFHVLPSSANFVLGRHPNHSGVELTEALKRQGILVRSWTSEALLPWVRISVGSEAQQQSLLTALAAILDSD